MATNWPTHKIYKFTNHVQVHLSYEIPPQTFQNNIDTNSL